MPDWALERDIYCVLITAPPIVTLLHGLRSDPARQKILLDNIRQKLPGLAVDIEDGVNSKELVMTARAQIRACDTRIQLVFHWLSQPGTPDTIRIDRVRQMSNELNCSVLFHSIVNVLDPSSTVPRILRGIKIGATDALS